MKHLNPEYIKQRLVKYSHLQNISLFWVLLGILLLSFKSAFGIEAQINSVETGSHQVTVDKGSFHGVMLKQRAQVILPTPNGSGILAEGLVTAVENKTATITLEQAPAIPISSQRDLVAVANDHIIAVPVSEDSSMLFSQIDSKKLVLDYFEAQRDTLFPHGKDQWNSGSTELFYLGVTEVTVEQYELLCDGYMPSKPKWKIPNYPVLNITADLLEGRKRGSDSLLQNINAKLIEANIPWEARIPTVQQWTLALLAQTEAGATPLPQKTPTSSEPEAVAQHPHNALVLHDMLGNAGELCYLSQSRGTDTPYIMGGSWNSRKSPLAPGKLGRVWTTDSSNADTVGIRIALVRR